MPRVRKNGRPQRLTKGGGGVESRGNQFRARKRKKGYKDLYGPFRDTWEEAYADLPTLVFNIEPESPAKPTLSQFMRDYLVNHRMRQVEEGTWTREEITWRTRIDGTKFGNTPIDEIDEDACQAFIDGPHYRFKTVFAIDQATGKKDRTKWTIERTDVLMDPLSVKRMGTQISAYFAIAKAAPYRYVKTNPMRDVHYPKRKKSEARRKSLLPTQAAGMKANLLSFGTGLRSQGDRFEAMVLTARDTGMRRGELCALLRNRVQRSSKGAYLIIDAGRVRTKGGTRQSSTKTGVHREIAISDEAFERIMSLPARKDPESGEVFAFSTESGRAVRPDNFTRDFDHFRKAIGLPSLRLHNLRHTYISLMLRAGVDLKTIQKQVGHADPRMIMEVYGETFDDQQRASVAKFADVLADAEKELESQKA